MAHSALAVAQQPLDLGAQRRRDVGALQRIGDVGGEEADLRAAVEAAGPRTSARRTAASSASLIIASVSWISPPAPRFCVAEDVEDLRLQDVAAGDDEVRRRLLARRLLDHLGDLEHLALASCRRRPRRTCATRSIGTSSTAMMLALSLGRVVGVDHLREAAAARAAPARRAAAARTARCRPARARTTPRGRGRAATAGG